MPHRPSIAYRSPSRATDRGAAVVRVSTVSRLEALEYGAAGALAGLLPALMSLWVVGDEWLLTHRISSVARNQEMHVLLAGVPVGMLLALLVVAVRRRWTAPRLTLSTTAVSLDDVTVRSVLARGHVDTIELSSGSLTFAGPHGSIVVTRPDRRSRRKVRRALARYGWSPAA